MRESDLSGLLPGQTSAFVGKQSVFAESEFHASSNRPTIALERKIYDRF